MFQPIKLMRGVVLALAIVFAAPLAATGLPGAGFGAAVAQERDPLIASVLFEGNQGFSDAQLIAMVDVATRGVANPAIIAADAESIRLAYEAKGYANVRVTTRTETTESGRVRLVFEVNEGQRAGIAAINFTGNNSINAGTLKSVMKTRETHLLSWLFRDDSYDPQKVAFDRELIRIYYGNRGFPDAVVTSAVAEFDAARNAYFLNFTIAEGEQYQIGNVSVETSINGLNADALTGTIRTHQGNRYSLADLERSQADMAFEATAQGYPFADVRPRINRNMADRTFDVTYLVDNGPTIYIERIEITGNQKTRDFVIRRELGFAEGDPFNRSMVQRAKGEVEALGFFKTVSIDLQPGSAADKVLILINVEEDSTGDYGATVGYASDQGILGEISLTERNFLGRGQYLRVAVGASQTGKSFDFSFTEPRFMGLRISAGVDAYHRITDETASSFYGSTATGGQVRFGLPVTRDISASVFTGVEQRSFVDGTAPFSSIVTNGQVRNKAWVGYSLTYDGLDNAQRPTEGLYAILTQQYMGWDYNLLRSEAKARYYMPLMDTGIVASVKGQAGIMNTIGTPAATDALEAFYLGSTVIRGFQPRQLGPRHAVSGEAIGATMYAAASAEIEFPIPVLPETYGINGAVWADAAWISGVPGGLPATATSVDNPFKASVGASLIWYSPFGPLRGDVGYVLSKATDDKTQIFQLTIQNLL